MTDSVSILLVGCGAVSQLFYAPTLRELKRHGIVYIEGVVDPLEKARTNLGRELGAPAFSSLEKGLKCRPKLVIVASPPKFHREQTEMCLRSETHVLCEKPLASNAADARAMAEAARESGKLLAVGHYKRFMPAHWVLRDCIEKKTFGALQHIEMAEGGKFGWPAATDSFFRPEQTPGGVLYDIGVHVLDLILWWLGEPERFEYQDDRRDGLEANCVLTARFANHASLRLRLSRDWPTPQCYYFRFERAGIHCRVNASNFLELSFEGLEPGFAARLTQPAAPKPTSAAPSLETNAQSFIAQLENVCKAIRGEAPLEATAEDGVNVMNWIEQCYARRIPLSEPWNEPPPQESANQSDRAEVSP
ncbi:MAG: Gfo/Idh/MocA family oxidoreductase [Verrucomicrobia bacterium]|nr:Gfo/Idh/MocA family oxidoreductase [Verrucomicrobiota bacterium]